jgi:hypothetical protein
MPTIDEAVRRVLNAGSSNKDHVAVAIWSGEDIDTWAKDEMRLPYKIRRKLATRKAHNLILDELDHHHDAEQGITWVHIQYEIEEYIHAEGLQ